MERSSGILMHISSLPSKYGIGSFGKECYKFVDFLKSAGQKYWQVLPLNQTGFGNSPYQSCSANSLNPYFIDLDILYKDGLLTKNDLIKSVDNSKYINYGKLYYERFPLLKKAFLNFDENNKDFTEFIKNGKFDDYALFMTLKSLYNGRPFYEWDDCFKFRDKSSLNSVKDKMKGEYTFWLFLQFEAYKQWKNVKEYANKNGIKIIGDMPLYVAYDSVDVWVNPKLFKLDKNLTPKKVAGVPPDYFSATGQLWGNPVYDYKMHEADNFEWWTKRIKNLLNIFDCVRIDHFRGLDRFYEIPFGNTDAIIGNWVHAPYKKLFNRLNKILPKNSVIAEDLGVMDDGVKRLLKYTGFPGMKVLDFAFDGNPNNEYLPVNISNNYVCYTGTHDNGTLISFVNGLNGYEYERLLGTLKYQCKALKVRTLLKSSEEIAKTIIALGFASKADLFILPMTDVCLLNDEYRMNEPSTLKDQNWAIKLENKHFLSKYTKYLNKMTQKFNR